MSPELSSRFRTTYWSLTSNTPVAVTCRYISLYGTVAPGCESCSMGTGEAARFCAVVASLRLVCW